MLSILVNRTFLYSRLFCTQLMMLTHCYVPNTTSYVVFSFFQTQLVANRALHRMSEGHRNLSFQDQSHCIAVIIALVGYAPPPNQWSGSGVDWQNCWLLILCVDCRLPNTPPPSTKCGSGDGLTKLLIGDPLCRLLIAYPLSPLDQQNVDLGWNAKLQKWDMPSVDRWIWGIKFWLDHSQSLSGYHSHMCRNSLG